MKTPPNAPCPCGSGRKFKKCHGGAAAPSTAIYSRADRISSLQKLDRFIERTLAREYNLADELFWGEYLEDRDDVPDEHFEMSDFVQRIWFAFSYEFESLQRPVDLFLASEESLSVGERAYLAAMRATEMRVYEIVSVVPGSTMTVRDVLETAGTITVNERSASQQLRPTDWIATRVLTSGASGGPEFDGGILNIPALLKNTTLDTLRRLVAAVALERRNGTSIDLLRMLPVIVHQIWVSAFIDPPVPELQNTEGDELIWSRSRFAMSDVEAVRRALDAATSDGVERTDDEDSWTWTDREGDILLAALEIDGSVLTAHTNSVERTERIRALLERIAGGAVRFQATGHENVRRALHESVKTPRNR